MSYHKVYQKRVPIYILILEGARESEFHQICRLQMTPLIQAELQTLISKSNYSRLKKHVVVSLDSKTCWSMSLSMSTAEALYLMAGQAEGILALLSCVFYWWQQRTNCRSSEPDSAQSTDWLFLGRGEDRPIPFAVLSSFSIFYS